MTSTRFQITLSSPLPAVSDAAWGRYVTALKVQPIRAVSASGGFGLFDLRPRRLVEIGVADGLRAKRTSKGRLIYECDLMEPLVLARFLEDPLAQYQIFTKSTEMYHADLTSGKITRPEGATLAGTLAVLHRAGRGALTSWPDLFPQTLDLYQAAQGAF